MRRRYRPKNCQAWKGKEEQEEEQEKEEEQGEEEGGGRIMVE